MKKSGEKKQIFQVDCPNCHSRLWIDPLTEKVIKTEKIEKKKGTLDDLLLKEKIKREEFERKFEVTAELEKKQKEKAKERFEKAFTKIDED